MTLLEQRTLWTFVASGLIFLWFQHRMLDGWRVAEQSPSDILSVLVVVVVLTIGAYAAIATVLAVRMKGAVAADERDALIESKATRNELAAVYVLVNIGAFQLLLNAAYSSPFLPMIELTHLPTLAFALFTLLWVGEFVRLASILIYSRL